MITALVHHLVESTVFAGVVAIFPFLMRKRAAASRHLVWLIAAAKFALPVALFSFAGIELRGLFPARPALFAAPPVLSSFLSVSTSVTSSPQVPAALPFLLLAAWLCGAAVMLAVWLRRLRAPAGPSIAPPESETELLARLARQVGVCGRVVLRATGARIEPGVTGLRRHTITVPEGLSSGLEASEFEAVLLHELAHVKRRDNLTVGFVHALVCVFWFHPLLWWIERRVIAEQERACDEMALRCGATPDDYASGILKVCRFHLAAAGACGFAGSSLKNRFEGIMTYEPKRLIERAPRLLIGALVLAMIVVPIVFGFFTSTASYARGADNQGHFLAPPGLNLAESCTFESITVPVGWHVQSAHPNAPGGVPPQACVEGPHGRPMWVQSKGMMREGAQKLIIVPPVLPVTDCKPVSSPYEKLCVCEGFSKTSGVFSPGAPVYSPVGPPKGWLVCRGNTWSAATPEVFGGHLPPPPKQ